MVPVPKTCISVVSWPTSYFEAQTCSVVALLHITAGPACCDSLSLLFLHSSVTVISTTSKAATVPAVTSVATLGMYSVAAAFNMSECAQVIQTIRAICPDRSQPAVCKSVLVLVHIYSVICSLFVESYWFNLSSQHLHTLRRPCQAEHLSRLSSSPRGNTSQPWLLRRCRGFVYAL